MAQPMARPVMRCDHVHVLCVQMGPWLAVEIPALVAAGRCARDSQTATRTRHPPPASRVALALPLLTCACARQDHTQGRGEGCVRLSTKSALLLRWPAGCASVCVRAYRLGRLCRHLAASLQLGLVTGRFTPQFQFQGCQKEVRRSQPRAEGASLRRDAGPAGSRRHPRWRWHQRNGVAAELAGTAAQRDAGRQL